MMLNKLKIGDTVIHRLDPLNRKLKVVDSFRWFGHTKIVTHDEKGEQLKDYDYEFIKEEQNAKVLGSHWEDCWKVHPGCALVKLEKLLEENKKLKEKLGSEWFWDD